jgi:hypothetical protein
MVEMFSRWYDRLTSSVQGRKDGAKGVPLPVGDGPWTTPHLHGYLGGRLRARLDLELVRLAGELRVLDPAITRQRLIVLQHQRRIGEMEKPAAPGAPRDPADKREFVDYLRSRRRYRAELDRATGFREMHRGQRDEAERKLVELLADRVRLLDETVGRLHAHVADAQALSGIYARRVLRRHEAGAELSRRVCSLEVDLTEYLDRVAALAEPPQVTPEG